MTKQEFMDDIRAGIPEELPAPREYDLTINHAPKRKDILTPEEKKLALRNALRYFPKKFHATLAPEFAEELKKYGRIYMYRFRPTYDMYARPIDEYPHKSEQAAAIMLMIQNNLDPKVAQHPHELITYGGNGSVFMNWAQYRLAMKYLSEMTDEQTLVMYSGHPLGLFPDVKKVSSSHGKRQTTFTIEHEVDEDAIRKAITDLGYDIGTITKETVEKKKGLFSFLG